MDPIRKEVCEPVAAICLLVVVRYMHCSLKKVGVEKTFEAWLQMHQNFSGLFETLGEKHRGVRSPLHKTFDSRLSFVAIHTLNSYIMGRPREIFGFGTNLLTLRTF